MEAGWWGDLVALQGLRWLQRTAHLPFHLETDMQIKCGLCQAPGMPLPRPGPSPSQPTSTSSLQTPFSSGADLTPRTAPQVQERSGTVAPHDRWTEGNLKIYWRPHGSVKYTTLPLQPNSGSCQGDGRLHRPPLQYLGVCPSPLILMPENWHPEFRAVAARPPA